MGKIVEPSFLLGVALDMDKPAQAVSQTAPIKTVGISRRRLFVSIPVATAVIALMAGAAYMFRAPLQAALRPPAHSESISKKPAEIVRVAGPLTVSVAQGSALESRLTVVPARKEAVDLPVFNATGSVMARLPAGRDLAESRWDFAAPEVATAYGDWVKAKADVEFAEEQAKKVRELSEARNRKLAADVSRMEKLFKLGTEAERDLAAVQADKLQTEIQGRKDIHEAENAVKAAIRNRGLLERQLLQAGVDPEVVARGTVGLVLVVADVPESRVGLVKEGQACEARFFSHPNQVYKGRVGRVGPSLAKDRRTLRVTFELHDPAEKLLPGLFAEVGLGAEHREVVTVPADAVLHAGRHDYVLTELQRGEYHAREVQVDEPLPVTTGAAKAKDSQLIVTAGLRDGERVVAAGAILLKPVMVKSLNGDSRH